MIWLVIELLTRELGSRLTPINMTQVRGLTVQLPIDMADSKKKCRQYNANYINYGFIPSPINTTLPMCLLCDQVFSNEAMKPSRLQDHLIKKHPDKASKDPAYFKSHWPPTWCGGDGHVPYLWLASVVDNTWTAFPSVVGESSPSPPRFPHVVSCRAGIQPSTAHAVKIPQPPKLG